MAKDSSRLNSLLNESSRAMGFTNGYVAGNIQFGFSVVESHISSLIHSFKQLQEIELGKTKELVLEAEKLLSTAYTVIADNPLITLSYLIKSLTKFKMALDDLPFEHNVNLQELSKRIIYHYLSLAKQIKDTGLTNLTVELAEKNRKKILDNAA